MIGNHIVARVYRMWTVGILLLLGAGLATWLTLAAPKNAIYNSVPTIAPAILVCCAVAILAASLLAVPRIEAAEITSARKLWRLRITVVIILYLALLPVAVLICWAANSSWFLMPLLRDSILVAAITFAAAVILPRWYVACAALGYVAACYFLARGNVAWDLILSHPNKGNIAAAGVLAIASCVAYAAYGARALPPNDDY